MRLENILFSHSLSQPEKTALICGENRLNWGDLGNRVRSVARGLAARGIGSGDKVILYMSNQIEFAEAFFGVLATGAVVVPATTRISPHELAYFQADSGAGLIICDANLAEKVAAEVSVGAEIYTVGETISDFADFSCLRQSGTTPLPPIPLEQDEAAILYTSGTTGQPKGVVLTHANILVCHGYMNAVEWGINGDDIYLVVSPMAHRAGMGRMINALMLGGTLNILSRFDPDDVLSIIEREQVTVLGLVPTMCRMMMPVLEADPQRAASLRRLAVTGEAFPVPLKERLIALLPNLEIVSFFGMTEAGGVTGLMHREQFTHAGSVGRPCPGVEVRITDEDGRDVMDGEAGELLVRAGRPGAFTVMKGYLNNPEQTEAAFSDGWFRTGDMARRDADGYLYIVDRKKDMIVSGGLNIYSKEVEQTITELPGIADVAVIAVPDDVFGESVVAVIEPEKGAVAPDKNQIVEHCRQRIAGYKKPKYVLYRSELPRNATGKILKRDLLPWAVAEITATTDQAKVAS
ncbi:class I adenylate-forming enzyme family protein [Pseudochrobactrum asaccharolyticum]|uniref:Fatty-acyl-CoA synthase/long-chain acyl-CoA synthetase n=1 Tax=Pseudochrobactrum asaccharolyticum TaxID=354351 RepID=A0A366DK07_9HYPH|nr:AMP-binding protein [Pseudochrobactrum asaccharolyticum]MBX8802362.1 long-chain fatty acid--CoA ligase [Ochrobactrum sp. MR28]MBX8817880.1 long-chain fatty acid--CoA ligase [Ochrobactrum sp. MR31]RBO90412.1 fatty-acyl-CoA synthase/long-chain acyl-CoA synthetase [Pseudochrobactrum asaccharolyticum]